MAAERVFAVFSALFLVFLAAVVLAPDTAGLRALAVREAVFRAAPGVRFAVFFAAAVFFLPRLGVVLVFRAAAFLAELPALRLAMIGSFQP